MHISKKSCTFAVEIKKSLGMRVPERGMEESWVPLSKRSFDVVLSEFRQRRDARVVEEARLESV